MMEEKKCPQCHFTLAKLQDIRRLGCGYCFKVFADELAPAITGLQKQALHVGRKPQMSIKSQTDQLTIQLKKAIAQEAYEEDAKIKQKLSLLTEST